jgi:hypothetical protein
VQPDLNPNDAAASMGKDQINIAARPKNLREFGEIHWNINLSRSSTSMMKIKLCLPRSVVAISISNTLSVRFLMSHSTPASNLDRLGFRWDSRQPKLDCLSKVEGLEEGRGLRGWGA